MTHPRIALITSLYPLPAVADRYDHRKGGVERYVHELAKALRALGFDVVIVAPGERSGRMDIGGIDIVNFPRSGLMFETPLFNPLRMFSAVGKCDLIHAQGVYPLVSDLTAVLGIMRDTPTVMTYHFDPVSASPLGRATAAAYRATLGRLVGLHDRVILGTESYIQNARFIKRLPRSRIRIIPMGVDTSYFVPDARVMTERRFLFVGRLVHFKGIHTLIRAMAIVNRTLPDYELAIVGTGELEESLRQEAARTGANARLLGKVSDEDLLHLYRTSVATVLASDKRQESFGMTLIESMSCGTPVVATDIPGVREVGRISGILAKPGSEESLASAMLEAAKVMLAPAEKADLHSLIESRFSWSHVAEKTADVYRELL